MPKGLDAAAKEIVEEEARQLFEADAISDLSNVLPLEVARNEGRFYGRLIRGRPTSPVQRIGRFLIGFMFSSFGILRLCADIPRLGTLTGLSVLNPENRPNPFYIPIAVIWLVLGLAAILKAFAPNRSR